MVQCVEDWIEIFNDGAAVADLSGWHLTDDAALLDKWTFPAAQLDAGERLVVFASGDDVPDGDGNLHTNFRLDGDGDLIALVRDDLTVASQIAADGSDFPNQRPDVSFGTVEETLVAPLISPGATGRMLVPVDDSLGTSWTGAAEPFTDDPALTDWFEVAGSVGYETRAELQLMGYWDFEGDTGDRSGNGRDGTLTGPTFSTDTPAALGTGSSLAFDGVDDFVDLSAHVGDFAALDGGTISAWIRTAGTGTHVVVGASDQGDGSSETRLFVERGPMKYDVRGEVASGSQLVSTENVNDDQWHHVAIVVDADVATRFVDGEQVASQYETFFSGVADLDQMAIGRNVDSGGPQMHFSGQIDDVAIWAETLDAEKIVELAGGASPLAVGGIGHAIDFDVETQMHQAAASAYLRYSFDVDEPSTPRATFCTAPSTPNRSTSTPPPHCGPSPSGRATRRATSTRRPICS